LIIKKFRSIKSEIRVLGIDDGSFVPQTSGSVDVVGVVYRGGNWFEGLIRSKVTIDGFDAIEKIASMIKNSPFYGELRIAFLDGISFAGFNVVDINQLSRMLDMPVISVVRDKPDLEKIKRALHHLPDFLERWNAIENAGKLIEVKVRKNDNPIFIQIAGILLDDAERIIKITSTHSNIPEALRVAHIVASGLTCQ
jgi:endonuclease V-like protein UPF0215 family